MGDLSFLAANLEEFVVQLKFRYLEIAVLIGGNSRNKT